MAPTNREQLAKHSSQGAFVIWHGMNVSSLCRFLAMRPPLSVSRFGRLALLPGMAMYNSAMGLAENLVYGRAVEQTEIKQPPIFILGYWRSGTTLLHNLFTRDPRFTFPNLYQTFFPWHFLLTERLMTTLTAGLVPESRPMDNVKCAWDLPQEDDVALCIMSLVSPYLLTAWSGDFSVYTPTFDFKGLPEKDVQRWKDALMLLVKKVTYRTPKPLILKSPSHTYRIPMLLEMFPGAKFVYISRNPYNVFNSTLHLRKTMIEENTLGKVNYDGHEEEVIRTFRHGFECYERDRHLIPEGDLHELRFEDLEQDPIGEMEQCYDTLGLGEFDTLRSILEPELPQLRRYRKNKFRPDTKWMERVYNELRSTFDRFGYPSPLDEVETAAA